jgi:hypothetical protein
MIEGVVMKPCGYDAMGRNGLAMAKFVAPAFREVAARAQSDYKKAQRGGDIIDVLGNTYRTEARWTKALQALRDEGKLTMQPSDVPALMQRMVADVESECMSEIAGKLAAWAGPQLRRALVRGMAEWYKDWLLKQQLPKE